MSYQSKWSDLKGDILAIAEQVKQDQPEAWNELKIPHQESRAFINYVSIACLKAGIPVGVNLKRGGPQQSIDVIALPNDTGCADSTGTYQGLELIDLVGGAEGPNPSLIWGDVTQPTIDSGNPGGWVAGKIEHPKPVYPPYPGDDVFDAVGAALFTDYAKAEHGPDGQMGRWFGRTIYDWLAQVVPTLEASIVKHQLEWRDGLNHWRVQSGLPPIQW